MLRCLTNGSSSLRQPGKRASPRPWSCRSKVDSHHIMLSRNLLHTAITHARRLVGADRRSPRDRRGRAEWKGVAMVRGAGDEVEAGMFINVSLREVLLLIEAWELRPRCYTTW